MTKTILESTYDITVYISETQRAGHPFTLFHLTASGSVAALRFS